MRRRGILRERSKWGERAARSLRESCAQSRMAELQRRLLDVLSDADIERLRQECKDDPAALKLLEEILSAEGNAVGEERDS